MKEQFVSNSESPLSDNPHSVTELLAAVTETQYKEMVDFARKRLRRLILSDWLRRWLAIVDAEDLVAEAILKAELGEQDEGLGRQLKPEQLVSTETFIMALRGIINSDLSHLVQSGLRHQRFLSEKSHAARAHSEDSITLIVRRDLHRVLFSKLYERVSKQPSLLPIVRDWQKRFLDDDRIGGNGHHRTLIHRVREMAREILEELAQELPASEATGKRMLM